MDYTLPTDNSQNSSKSNNNPISLSEIDGGQLFDPNIFGTWLNIDDSNSESSKTVIDCNNVKTELQYTDLSIIPEQDEESNNSCDNTLVFLSYIYIM
jgi:hypothetical protein